MIALVLDTVVYFLIKFQLNFFSPFHIIVCDINLKVLRSHACTLPCVYYGGLYNFKSSHFCFFFKFSCLTSIQKNEIDKLFPTGDEEMRLIKNVNHYESIEG